MTFDFQQGGVLTWIDADEPVQPPIKLLLNLLLLWIVFVSYASCWNVLCCRVCSLQPCGHLLGKGWRLGYRVCCVFLCFVTSPNVSWSTSELRARLAPWNWFKPSSKIFYWPFQGGTSFVDLLCFFSVLCLLCLCERFFLFVPCGHLPGKGWLLGSRLWCPTVGLSLSHWYPGSGVVLDCIGSWSLHPYLLRKSKCSSVSSLKVLEYSTDLQRLWSDCA